MPTGSASESVFGAVAPSDAVECSTKEASRASDSFVISKAATSPHSLIEYVEKRRAAGSEALRRLASRRVTTSPLSHTRTSDVAEEKLASSRVFSASDGVMSTSVTRCDARKSTKTVASKRMRSWMTTQVPPASRGLWRGSEAGRETRERDIEASKKERERETHA